MAVSKTGEKIIAALEESLKAIESDGPLDERLTIRRHAAPDSQTPCNPPRSLSPSNKHRERSDNAKAGDGS